MEFRRPREALRPGRIADRGIPPTAHRQAGAAATTSLALSALAQPVWMFKRSPPDDQRHDRHGHGPATFRVAADKPPPTATISQLLKRRERRPRLRAFAPGWISRIAGRRFTATRHPNCPVDADRAHPSRHIEAARPSCRSVGNEVSRIAGVCASCRHTASPRALRRDAWLSRRPGICRSASSRH